MHRHLTTIGVTTLREPGELAFEPRRISLVEKALTAIVAVVLLGAVLI